jgi:hypothetical protein
VWEVVIGKNQFAPISGLFYPDGSIRRASSIEAVAGRTILDLKVKPDAEGVPVARQRAGRLAEYLRFMSRNEITDSTWRERNTAVAALIVHGVYNPDAADVLKRLEKARTAHAGGQCDVAYRAVAELLSRAAEILTERDKAKAAKDEQSRTIDAAFFAFSGLSVATRFQPRSIGLPGQSRRMTVLVHQIRGKPSSAWTPEQSGDPSKARNSQVVPVRGNPTIEISFILPTVDHCLAIRPPDTNRTVRAG